MNIIANKYSILKRIIFSAFILSFSMSCASVKETSSFPKKIVRSLSSQMCEVGFLENFFPVLDSETIHKNQEALCQLYREYSETEQCLINEAAKKCSRLNTAVMSFGDCLKTVPNTLFSTILKPGSNKARKVCQDFESKLSGSVGRVAHNTQEGEVEIPQGNISNVMIILPFEIKPTIKQSEQRKIKYSIFFEKKVSVEVAREAFKVKYNPRTGWLVINLEKAPCKQRYIKEGSNPEEHFLGGVCLTDIKFEWPETKGVRVEVLSLKEMAKIEIGVNESLKGFVDKFETEHAQSQAEDFLELN